MQDRAHSQGKNYRIRHVRSLDAFCSLKDAWNRLAYQEGSCSPFLNHEWFNLWIDHFLNSNELYILLVYESHKLVAIAPFLLKKQVVQSIRVNKIELIGNVYSPMRSFIFGNACNENRQECLSHIFKYLANNFHGWDLLDLTPFSESGGELELVRCVLREGSYKYQEEFAFENWYVDDIQCSGDEYLDQRSKKVRSELRRRRTRLEALGDLEFRIVKNGNEIDRYMDYYYEVYAKSWKGKEKIGPTFHRGLAKLAAEKGWLRLAFLFLNGTPIASQFRIVFKDTCFFLKTAYDLQYRKYGPGIILLSDMIKYVIDVDHARDIDFGPGDESYKSSWASQRREMRRIIIFNNTLKGRFLALLKLKVSPFFQRHETLREIKNRISWDFMKFRL